VCGTSEVGTFRFTRSVDLLESSATLAVIKVSVAFLARDTRRVYWAPKVGTIHDAGSVLLLETRVALTVVKTSVAVLASNASGL
jgi:hypothetical protein